MPAPPRIVSCYPRAASVRATPGGCAGRCRELGLDVRHSSRSTAVVGDQHGSLREGRFPAARCGAGIGEPLLFVEADAVLRQSRSCRRTLVAISRLHKWNRWEMSARTLYFGASAAAEALLQTWQHLAASYPASLGRLSARPGLEPDVVADAARHGVAAAILSCRCRRGRATAGHDRPHLPHRHGRSRPRPGLRADLARGARRAGRTGARDSLLVIKSPGSSKKGITVILRDVEAAARARSPRASRRVTGAFAKDCGGFGQLELSLCPWQDDVARRAGSGARRRNNRVLEIAPWQDRPAICSVRCAQSRSARPGRRDRRAPPLTRHGSESRIHA